MKLFSFRNFRVLFLLLLLAFVAIYTKSQRVDSTTWLEPLEVIIFPINGDNSAETEKYIRHLKQEDFSGIVRFFSMQAKNYPVYLDNPISVTLGKPVTSLPPPPPEAGGIKAVLWSLKLRWWAFRNTPNEYDYRTVRLYALFYQGEEGKPLRHSLGMQKGLLGVCHLYANARQNKQNNIVLSHELLHTVGATDKYDASGAPIFPYGYANPLKTPRFPQYRSEIMAGTRPISAREHKMGTSLKSSVIGEKTAQEIGWVIAE